MIENPHINQNLLDLIIEVFKDLPVWGSFIPAQANYIIYSNVSYKTVTDDIKANAIPNTHHIFLDFTSIGEKV